MMVIKLRINVEIKIKIKRRLNSLETNKGGNGWFLFSFAFGAAG